MTYDEAMHQAREEGRMVRRPEWDPGAAVNFIQLSEGEFDDVEVPTCVLWDLDNEVEIESGSHENFEPTPQDLIATDWEIYDSAKLFPDEDVEQDAD